jgi:hypothetical protein
MTEELGKIERPSTEEFQKGRRLFFVPIVYGGKEFPLDYLEKVRKYWKQVEEQLIDLELKLGRVSKIYHELVASSGDDGLKVLEGLNEGSYQVASSWVGRGARMEAMEDGEVLTEFMDWGRCLAVGLQNQKVRDAVYKSYVEAGKKRNRSISKRLDETLKPDEIGILFMREGHEVQFPAGIEVFYVAPPALDEVNRWLRDHDSQKERIRGRTDDE